MGSKLAKRGALALVATAGVVLAGTAIWLIGGRSDASAQVITTGEDTPATVSAIGVAQLSGNVNPTGGSLSMSIEERTTGTNIQGAVKIVQDKIAALREALEAAGIPASAIQTQGFNIGSMYGYPGPMPATPPDVKPLPPPVSGYTVNAQLLVNTTSAEQLSTAMTIAIESGATGVNSFNKGAPVGPPPDGSTLAPAIKQATEQAKVMAQASAAAAGVSLGNVSSVSVLPPTPSYGGPLPTVTWQVQVKVTYQLR